VSYNKGRLKRKGAKKEMFKLHMDGLTATEDVSTTQALISRLGPVAIEREITLVMAQNQNFVDQMDWFGVDPDDLGEERKRKRYKAMEAELKRLGVDPDDLFAQEGDEQ
jgi:hypothetical protein